MSEKIIQEEFDKLKKQSQQNRDALIALIAAMDQQKPHTIPRPVNTENATRILNGSK